MGGTPLTHEEINSLAISICDSICDSIRYLNNIYKICSNKLVNYYYKIYNYLF